MSQRQYLDSWGMWEATAGLPEQMLAAMAASADVLDAAALPRGADVDAVVILGMGSARTVADAVAAYGVDRSVVPVVTGHGYGAPSFVGPNTVVFAISFSGDTEETLAAASSARERGAHIVVVSGGGALRQMAEASDLTHFGLPGAFPAGRTALGALLVPVLLTLSRLGLVSDVVPLLEVALDSLRRRRDVLMGPGSPAEDVARLIGRTIPLIYGSTGMNAVAARRWKTQINENAKTPAFFSVQPELSHNEVAGWGQHGDVTRQVFSLVTLRHAGEHAQVARRFEFVVEATDEVMANVLAVWAHGDEDLSRFLDLVLFGDVVSLHMAGREETDPGPAPALSDVESALRQ